MATEDRWHDFAKEKPSEDMEGRNFIVSNGYSDTLSMWCGGYWENEPFMGNKLCDEVVRWKGYLTPEEEKANETTCNELKAHTHIDYNLHDLVNMKFYLAADVDALLAKKDAAIAELKAENERLNNALDKERSETIKYMDELCNAKNEIERLTIDKRNAEQRADVADATAEKLKAENECLKQKLEDVNELIKTARKMLEDAKATHYAEMVDAGMENRKLKRALWLARAERAKEKQQLFQFSFDYEKLCIDGFYDPYSGRRELSPKQWIKAFNKVKVKLLKKAEEYK